MTTSTTNGPRQFRRSVAREARDAFPPMGVYVLRCRESKHILLHAHKNVPAAINRARFELRMGSHRDRVAQAEWNQHGPEAVTFEILEMVKEREDPNFDYTAELEGLAEIHRELQGLAP